jgi:PAS domain S-box-containing protein
MQLRNTTNALTLTKRQANAIDQAMANVFDDWVLKLRCQLRESAGNKLNILEKDRKQRRDLLSLASRLLRPDAYSGKEEMELLLANVRRKEYSICDLFLELCCLEEAIGEYLRQSHTGDPEQMAIMVRWVRTCFKTVFQRVLSETSMVYETVAETGRAYCQVNARGLISYANEKMCRMLGVESAIGLSLPDFFGDNATDVMNAIQGIHGHKPLIRQLSLTSRSGACICVHAEIAPLFIDGEHRGAYATLSDMTLFTELQERVFERSPLGIIRVNGNLEFTYANRAAQDMIGVKNIEGVEISDFIRDEESRKTVRQQFERRKKGQSDEYEIEINRVDDGRALPVRIAATPEFDNMGNIIGALSIVRSLESERVAQVFHRHIEVCRDWDELLTAIAEETDQIIPNDLFLVSLYTSDMQHACVFFDYSKEELFAWPKRWFPLSPELVKWIQEDWTKPVSDLKAFLNEPHMQYLREEKSVQMLIDRGIKSFVRYPIYRAKNLIASLTLMSKRPNAFTKEMIERLKALPIDEAINTAIYYRNVEEHQFRFELMKKISNSVSVDDVMDTIVHSLVKFYKWQDVAIFRVDEIEQCLLLRAQAHSDKTLKYDESLSLSLDEGIIGEAYRANKAVNVGCVLDYPHYVSANEKTRSELCVPISLDGKVRWLVNVEDELENAFSEEEKDKLLEIVEEVSSIVGHLFAHFFRDEFIASASDAIFITDRKGQILTCNEAAAYLVGKRSIDEIVGRKFEGFLAEEDQDIFNIQTKRIRDHYHLIDEQKNPIDVFITGGELPEDFGCKVFCVKDLSLIQRVKELETIQDMFREITTQTRTPFSLLFTWLRKLRERIPSEAELLDKTILQLRKIELTYDRLVLYDVKDGVIPYNPLRLDLPSVIRAAIDELPQADRDKIEVYVPESLPHLSGDIFQLAFIFQTILAYLLRFVPVDEKIKINASDAESILNVRITGFIPHSRSKMFSVHSETVFEDRARLDLGLGETTIRRFVEDHNGNYERKMIGEEKIEFLLTLPTITRKD